MTTGLADSLLSHQMMANDIVLVLRIIASSEVVSMSLELLGFVDRFVFGSIIVDNANKSVSAEIKSGYKLWCGSQKSVN